MKHPNYRPLYRNSHAKGTGRLAQVIPVLIEGTNTMFFTERKYVLSDRWRDVTYGRIVVD